MAELVSYSIIFNTCMGTLFFLICFVFSDFLAACAIARLLYVGYLRLASFIILLQAALNSANAVFIGACAIGKIYLATFVSFALLEAFGFTFPLTNLLEATLASLCHLLLYLTLLPLLKGLTLQEMLDLERMTKKTRSLAIITKPFITYERILLTRTAKTSKM